MSPEAAKPKPPEHLQPDTQRWFAEVVDNYYLDSHHLKLLQGACEAWDEAQQCREILAREGYSFEDRFNQPKPRPEAGIEQNAMIRFARLIRELRLDDGSGEEYPRPPRNR
jgi:phage terminase small subunit